MNAHVNPFRAYIDATLERLGGLYTFDDIIEMVHKGDAQSFTEGDSWAVTQIFDTPRKRVLNVIFVAGRLKDIPGLHHQIEAWARKNGVNLIIGQARDEWEAARRKVKELGDLGYQRATGLFMKELD